MNIALNKVLHLSIAQEGPQVSSHGHRVADELFYTMKGSESRRFRKTRHFEDRLSNGGNIQNLNICPVFKSLVIK